MKGYKIFTSLTVVALLISSCGSNDVSKSGSASTTTGWDYNNEENGGFEVINYDDEKIGPGLVFVEGGTFSMGRVEQDVNFDWNNVPRRVSVSSFYMDESEVRNVDYREYLYWISRVFAEYPAVHQKALPDTLVWRNKMAYNEPYVEYYLRHPAYNEYPVVGVSWVQANDYCLWRTDRVNEKFLVDEGYLQADPNQVGAENFNTEAYLAGQYEGLAGTNQRQDFDPNKDVRRIKLEDGILLPKYRLPTEAEWEYAAFSLIGNTFDERIYERRLYPWNGHTLRNDDAKSRGQMRANYVRGRGDYMGTAGDLNDNAEIPAPVKSYWPNDYGLYCMAGNVNEWVMDVYRPLSPEDVNEFRPFRGNVFQELERDEEGNVAPKDSLGRLKYQDVTPEHAAGRKNYTKANYKNFLDGDVQSSIDYTTDNGEQAGSQRMYAHTQGDMSSLITDNVRVYKGGSWKDRAYWMSPGTRRFLDENASTDDLGFRCAMTKVGSPKGF
jgi:sulfatase modifying factor 1